ncbi:hypothetical protein Tco_1310975 [Tanacetum coccineum]
MIQPEPEGSTQGYPLDSVEVLRCCLTFEDCHGPSKRLCTTSIATQVSQQSLASFLKFDESNINVLERFYTSARNLVKEILLKLNLPDHRLLKDGGEEEKEGVCFLVLKFLTKCGRYGFAVGDPILSGGPKYIGGPPKIWGPPSASAQSTSDEVFKLSRHGMEHGLESKLEERDAGL